MPRAGASEPKESCGAASWRQPERSHYGRAARIHYRCSGLNNGRLAGFRYREIVRKLKARGFEFDREAAGSREIWFHAATKRYTTTPNHPGDMPEGTLRAILRHAGIDAEDFFAA
jgi:predicted RNA binding protein YcfA (HicA-like mRNA interferase family)